jgi:HprK-related kinase A
VHEFHVRIGPAAFRIGSVWRAPIEQMAALYAGYPRPEYVDFTVRLEAASRLRRWLRPSVAIKGDYMLPDAAPLPLSQGLLAAEMAMNLQLALGWRRHLLLHASAVERDGRVLVMTGASGSGKSTLAALLACRGWRFLGDEFVLLDPLSGDIMPFPRLISLKNSAIAAMEAAGPDALFGPLMRDTPKGDIRHMVLFPRFGEPRAVRGVAAGETFMRLTQASTNYVALGEAGFTALTRFVKSVPSLAIDYESGEEAIALVEQLWGEQA